VIVVSPFSSMSYPERGGAPAVQAFVETAREVTRPRRERIRPAA
jgi:hypothetical protein